VGLLLFTILGGFTLKWHLPVGCAVGVSGKILVADTDRDSCYELFISDFQLPDNIYICELHQPYTWELDSFSILLWQIACDIGDFDNDGLADLLCYGQETEFDSIMTLAICESPDSHSYPTNIVWCDKVGPPWLIPTASVYDFDNDNKYEIIQVSAFMYGNTVFYENCGNNQYNIVFVDTFSYYSPDASAFGDFDQDGNFEGIFPSSQTIFWTYESPDSNVYLRVSMDSIPTANIFDCIAIPDVDGDGKWEFMLKGIQILSQLIDVFIYEADSDNTYDLKKFWQFTGADYSGGHSDASDVDADGNTEIVIEGPNTVNIIKAAGNDSFYVWETLPGNAAGFNIKIFDLDNNGINDIIMSGAQQTWIYEYVPAGVEEQHTGMIMTSLSVHPNPFRRNLTIKYQISNTKFQTNSKIRNSPPPLPSPLEGEDKGGGNFPHVSLKIFDAAGRLTKQFNHLSTNQHGGIQPYNQVIWDGLDDAGRRVPAGVYFVQLEAEGERITEKVILLR